MESDPVPLPSVFGTRALHWSLFIYRVSAGCTLGFGTLTTSPVKAAGNTDPNSLMDGRKSSVHESISIWKEVKDDNEVPISFESRDKMRHKVCNTLYLIVQTPIALSSCEISMFYHHPIKRPGIPLRYIVWHSSASRRALFLVSHSWGYVFI